MTCHEVDAAIDARFGDALLPREVAEHVAQCERCRRLTKVLEAPQGIGAPRADGLRQIQASIVRNLKPVKPLASSGVLLSGFVICFVLVAIGGFLQLEAYGWEELSLWQILVVFASLSLGAGALAFSMVWQMRPGSKYAVSPSLLPAGVLLLLAAAMAAVFQPQEETDFTSEGLICLRIGLLYAVPGGLLSWLWLRRGAALAPKLTGATAGGFAALIGITVLEVHCPNLNLNHILVWHLGVLVIGSLAGMALGGAVDVSRHRRRQAMD